MTALVRKLNRLVAVCSQIPLPPLVVVLLIGGAVRVLLACASAGILWPDSPAYLNSAEAIATSFNFRPHEIYRTPGYPAFLALFFWLFGVSHTTGYLIQWAQQGLGLVSTALVFLIAQRVLSQRGATIAALLFTLFPTELYYELVVQTEAFFIPLFLGGVWSFLYLASPHTTQHSLRRLITQFFLFGLLCAAITLVRPIARPLFIIALLAILLTHRKRVVLPSLSAVVGFMLLVLPWMNVNRTTYGFFGISTDFGLNLFHKVYDVAELRPVERSKFKNVKQKFTKFEKEHDIIYFRVYSQYRLEKRHPKKIDQVMGAFAREALMANIPAYLANVAGTATRFLVWNRNSVFACEHPERGKYLCSSPRNRGIRHKAFLNYPSHAPYLARKWAYLMLQKLRVMPYITGAGFIVACVLCAWQLAARRGAFYTDRQSWIPLFAISLFFIAVVALLNREEDRFRMPIDPLLIIATVAALPLRGLSSPRTRS